LIFDKITSGVNPVPASIPPHKVTLNGSKPPVWRRFLVPDSISLHQLHTIIQIVMGWTNSHLPQYIIEAEYYAEPEEEVEGVLRYSGDFPKPGASGT
jgi:hypothetical protein